MIRRRVIVFPFADIMDTTDATISSCASDILSENLPAERSPQITPEKSHSVDPSVEWIAPARRG